MNVLFRNLKPNDITFLTPLLDKNDFVLEVLKFSGV